MFNGHAYKVSIKTTEIGHFEEKVRIFGRNFDVTVPDEWAQKITAAIDRVLKELCQEGLKGKRVRNAKNAEKKRLRYIRETLDGSLIND